jgi:hypothetical protein
MKNLLIIVCMLLLVEKVHCSGTRFLALDSVRMRVNDISLDVIAELDKEKNLQKIELNWNGNHISVPKSHLKFVESPNLRTLRLLGTGEPSSPPVHIIVSITYGEVVEHYDKYSKKTVYVLSEARFIFDARKLVNSEFAKPQGDLKNSWKLFELNEEDSPDNITIVESVDCPL